MESSANPKVIPEEINARVSVLTIEQEQQHRQKNKDCSERGRQDTREGFRTICPLTAFLSGERGIAYGWREKKTVDSMKKNQSL